MFAIVRTGGKQYRVAAGDRIAVEKLAGAAGDAVTLDDVLLASDGDKVQDLKGLAVTAEIVAQEKGEKVIIFKKRRRHNYRRKNGHRQQHTLLEITAIGSHKAEKKAAKPKAEAAPAVTEETVTEAPKAAAKKPAAEKTASTKAAVEKPAAKKPAAKKAAPKKDSE